MRAVGPGAGQPRRPAQGVALAGVVLALLGLLGSLFIRPRRMWVRARTRRASGTLVEVAGLDRSSGGDVAADAGDRGLAGGTAQPPDDATGGEGVTNAQWETLSVQAIAGCGGRLLPGPAGALSPSAASPPRRRCPAGAGRRPTDAASRLRPARLDRAAVFGRFGLLLTALGRRPRVAARAAGWPRTRTGCPGATCTSSRSPAPSWSPALPGAAPAVLAGLDGAGVAGFVARAS